MIDDWLLAWLVTFAAHSSLLIGLIWLASSSRLPDAVEESSWKVGAFGAILTSTLQCLWIAEPAGGHLARIGMPLPPPLDGELPASGIPSPLATSNGSSLLLLLLVLASAGALCQAGWRKLRLGRLLAERRRLDDPALLSVLRCVCARSGYRRRVALSSCESLRTPIAFGILRPEICLPGDAPTRLGDAELAAMLAHELAHLRAGDPFWL
ncbi:MAG: M56 family metallopeptidase, partial [Planctomycetota bacterium]